MLELKIFSNGELDEEEKVLVKLINDTDFEIILHGDYYHDKIYEKIEGFLEGLSYCGVKYTMKESEVIYESDELFSKLKFNL